MAAVAPGTQPAGVSMLHSSGVVLHGSMSGLSSMSCSCSSVVSAIAFMEGSDVRAASSDGEAAVALEPSPLGVSMTIGRCRCLMLACLAGCCARVTVAGGSVRALIVAISADTRRGMARRAPVITAVPAKRSDAPAAGHGGRKIAESSF